MGVGAMVSRRPQGSGIALLLCIPAVVVCAGCAGHGPAEETPEILRAHVVLPEYPYAENEAIRIDALLLDDLATAFLAGGGDPSEVARFFFSYVPLQAFDWLAAGPALEGARESAAAGIGLRPGGEPAARGTGEATDGVSLRVWGRKNEKFSSPEAGKVREEVLSKGWHRGSGAPVEPEVLEGLLYLSGFFGGVWLKGVLNSGGAAWARVWSPAGRVERRNERALHSCPQVPRRNRSLIDIRSPGRVRPTDFAGFLFSGLASFVDTLLKTARTAEPPALSRFLLDNLDAFILLYGYNRGYLESILEQPPRGVVPPAGYLACANFLGCRTPVPMIPALEEVLPLIERLEDPPDGRWESMRNKVRAVGPQAVEMGYRVWTDFLGVDEMRPEDYQVLLDLSAGFLIYCQLLVLTSMDAWVNEDEGTAREAVTLAAGMTAWVGGYGIGLISDYPVERLPVIEVSGRGLNG